MNKFVNCLKSNYILIIYCICSVCICWIGVCRSIGTGAQWAFTNNCLGFCAFFMIICRYNIRDFLKIPYFVWSILFLIVTFPIYRAMAPGTDFDAQYLSAILNVGLCGIVLIRLFYQFIVDKQFSKKLITPSFVIWFIMLFMCMISRNVSIWPYYYFIMLLGVYFAPLKEGQKYQVVKGIAYGIIISFVWIQSRAFLYRPYDTGTAYCGHFNNENVNGMLYVLSMSGIGSGLWIALCDTRRDDKNHRILKNKPTIAILWLLTVSMLDFALFTGSRSALLSIMAMIAIELLAYVIKFTRRKILSLIILSALIGTVAIFLIMPVYSCIRYIPALRHHPVWYGDYSEDKVHSWDPIDSPKYTTLEQALNSSAIARFLKYLPRTESQSVSFSYNARSQAEIETLDALPDGLFTVFSAYITTSTAIRTRDYPGGMWVYEYDDGVEPGTDEAHNGFVVEMDENNIWVDLSQYNPFGIRWYIWKYYFDRLNILGHRESYRRVFLSDWFGHAHNSFLQIAYYFGVIAGGAYLFLDLYIVIFGFCKLLKAQKKESMLFIFPVIFMMGFMLEGMFECASLTGLFLFSFYFLATGVMIIAERKSF